MTVVWTMDRVAVFVDAGYLLAEGARALSGRKLARADVGFDPVAAVSRLKHFAWHRTGLPLLRIYWYDGTANRPTRGQIALAEHADVKLRLGRVNSAGQQKGVDALMANDLVALARNRAMSDCVLLSGDDEMRIAVAEVQQLGVRVHVVGVAPLRETQSPFLRREADSTGEWDAGILGAFMVCRTKGKAARQQPLDSHHGSCHNASPGEDVQVATTDRDGLVTSGHRGGRQARGGERPTSSPNLDRATRRSQDGGAPQLAYTATRRTAAATRSSNAERRPVELAEELVSRVLAAEYHLRIGRYLPCAESLLNR